MRRLIPFILLAILSVGRLAAQSGRPSDAECEEYGQRLADCFSDGEMSLLVADLNVDGYMGRLIKGLNFTAQETTEFREGLEKGLLSAMEKQFATFTSGRFLRLQRFGNEQRILVRVLSEDGAVNYLAFVVGKTPGGKIQWHDCFTYLSGETMTESTRRLILPLVSQMRKGALGFLQPQEMAYAKAFPQLHKAGLLKREGKFIEAWHALEPLPDTVKLDRSVLLLRLQLAQAIDESKYLRVIQECERVFPDDGSFDLIAIDGDFLRKDFKSCLQRIDSVYRLLGGDPYLHVLAANVHLQIDEFADARRKARQALVEEDTLYGAYDILFAAGVRGKQYDETIAALEEFAARFPSADVDADIVQADESFAEFRASKEYKAWLAARPQQPEPAPEAAN